MTPAEAREIAVRQQGDADRSGQRFEGWVVLGNAAGLALIVSGLLSGKVPPAYQVAAAWSAWIYFAGILSGAVFLSIFGMQAHDKAIYFRDLAIHLEGRAPKPELPPTPRRSILILLAVSGGTFFVGGAIPLIMLAAALFSGQRLPVA